MLNSIATSAASKESRFLDKITFNHVFIICNQLILNKIINNENVGTSYIVAAIKRTGRTGQIVQLINKLIGNSTKTEIKRVLILMPEEVLLEWRKEFQIYETLFNFYYLSNIDEHRINIMLTKWFNERGVILIGHVLFERLTKGDSKDRFSVFFSRPDFVIEG